jgi:hypothetical protein
VLEYMGLSMDIDQVVNESIDGDTKRRALLPGNVLEANHWHEEYTWEFLLREKESSKKSRQAARQIGVRIQATRQARRINGGY